MSKVITFVLGFVAGGLGIFFLCSRFGLTDLIKSATRSALEARMESIPVEKICESIASGEQILGDDHVTAWTDGKSYLIAGWQVEKSGIPVFYWTGADLPTDVAECRKGP